MNVNGIEEDFRTGKSTSNSRIKEAKGTDVEEDDQN